MKSAPDVLAIVGPVTQFGSGHLRRMELLQSRLSLDGIHMTLLIDDTGWSEVPHGVRVVLLDRRDTMFPPAALLRRDCTLIAVDNLGAGAEQADVRYAALPNISMSVTEIRRSLGQIILPSEITTRPNLCEQAQLIRIKRGVPRADLVLHPYRERLSRKSFLKRLIKADSVACYYGQTLFEALYLGKKIFLYNISPLHGLLADKFFQVWQGLLYPRLYFDGRGLERLAALVKQAIRDGLPDPKV